MPHDQFNVPDYAKDGKGVLIHNIRQNVNEAYKEALISERWYKTVLLLCDDVDFYIKAFRATQDYNYNGRKAINNDPDIPNERI